MKKLIFAFVCLVLAVPCAGEVFTIDDDGLADSNSIQEAIGWPCIYNTDCFFHEYCAKEDGDCDGVGICQPRPELCIFVYDPVCGCDGITYGNGCFAAMAGVSVDYGGYCGCYYSGDFDCDGDVDLCDFSIFSSAWLTEPGYARWNPDCDIGFPADNFIDMLDLTVLAENYLKDPLY